MEKINISQFKNKKTALVLSGGVVKAGAWHLGVASALEDLGFVFKNNDNFDKIQKQSETTASIGTYVGSSAGSLICSYLASGFSPKDVIQANSKSDFLLNNHSKKSFNDLYKKIFKENESTPHNVLNRTSKVKPLSYNDIISLKSPIKKPSQGIGHKPFDGFPPIIKQLLLPFTKISGIFSTDGISSYLKNHILTSGQFEDLKSDLFIVATQLDHSRKVIFSRYNYPSPLHDTTANYYTGIPIYHAAAASMSVPPFYSPYPIHNPQTQRIDYYIDGEIRETLSTHVAIDNQCEYVISSWTHTPYHYHDEIGSLINFGIPAICVQSIYLMIQKKIVANRNQRLMADDILSTISDYMKTEKLPEIHRKNIISILEKKLNYNPHVKLIDIYPKHEDYQLFFSSFFSLNPDTTLTAANMGYREQWKSLKNYYLKNDKKS